MQVLLRQQMMLVKILVTYLKLSWMSTGLPWRISPLETKFLSWISSPSKLYPLCWLLLLVMLMNGWKLLSFMIIVGFHSRCVLNGLHGSFCLMYAGGAGLVNWSNQHCVIGQKSLMEKYLSVSLKLAKKMLLWGNSCKSNLFQPSLCTRVVKNLAGWLESKRKSSGQWFWKQWANE